MKTPLLSCLAGRFGCCSWVWIAFFVSACGDSDNVAYEREERRVDMERSRAAREAQEDEELRSGPRIAGSVETKGGTLTLVIIPYRSGTPIRRKDDKHCAVFEPRAGQAVMNCW